MLPDCISLMTLIVNENTKLQQAIATGEFLMQRPNKLVCEAICLVEQLMLSNTNIRMNHASNFVNLEGKLPMDKAGL